LVVLCFNLVEGVERPKMAIERKYERDIDILLAEEFAFCYLPRLSQPPPSQDQPLENCPVPAGCDASRMQSK
jgi:hypothetical protein